MFFTNTFFFQFLFLRKNKNDCATCAIERIKAPKYTRCQFFGCGKTNCIKNNATISVAPLPILRQSSKIKLWPWLSTFSVYPYGGEINIERWGSFARTCGWFEEWEVWKNYLRPISVTDLTTIFGKEPSHLPSTFTCRTSYTRHTHTPFRGKVKWIIKELRESVV